MADWWFQTLTITKWEYVLYFVSYVPLAIAIIFFEILWIRERRKNKSLVLSNKRNANRQSNIKQNCDSECNSQRSRIILQEGKCEENNNSCQNIGDYNDN